jgi:adenosine deaminase
MIDLHLHLDGALRTATILALADKAGVALPERTVTELEKHVTVGPECRSLVDFLRCFDVFLPVLRSAEAMERVAFELVEDQRRDGVTYFEARYAPILQAQPGFPLEASVEAVLAGLTRGDPSRRWGLILCALRDHPPETSLATARAAVSFRDRGVVGFDIAGNEAAPAAPHRPAFDYVRRHDLPATAHAGEAGPAANIAEAIDALGARRIGHGVRVVDDPELLRRAIDRGIVFEQCLTSNLQTRSVRSLAEHPFPRLLRAGALVTLNTDDPAVSRITLSGELELAKRAFALSDREIERVAENAARAAFGRP